MRVKPAPGKLIRCPETKELYSETDEINVPKFTKYHSFWVRRVRDGDAIVTVPDVRAAE